MNKGDLFYNQTSGQIYRNTMSKLGRPTVTPDGDIVTQERKEFEEFKKIKKLAKENYAVARTLEQLYVLYYTVKDV